MAIVIKPKRSETADSAPGTSDIVDGEIAVNIADKKIYIRHSDDTIVTLSDGANLTSGSTSTIDATTDIILDADGGDIFFKDGGTTFGSATNTSGNLIVKSGTTTALTFSGANVTAAGTYSGGGTMTTGGNIVIPNAGNIGSASDTDAIAIASDGKVTFSQEIVATSLDISGDVDVDGTLETDALTIGGTSLAETIADTVGAMVGSNTETGIAVTYEDGDNTLDFVLGAAQTTITSIYNSSLAIGYGASDANINFGTDNQITFDIDGTGQIVLKDGIFHPVTDSDVDLGKSDKYWKDAYIDTITTTGLLTTGGNIVIPNAGNIGSAGDTDAIAIASDGVVTFSQNPVGTLATAAQTNITSLGTLTALTVDDVAINGKVITMTGSSSDTAVFTAGTNGTLSIVTTDDAAAAANITITADGTFEADGTTITLDSAGDIVLDADGGDVFFKDGGTTFGSATNTSGNLIVKSGTTTALTFSGANVTAAGTIGSGAITSTGVVTGTGFTIGSAAILEAELEIIDGATITTDELNLLDGDTSVGSSITVADGDGFIVNDGGTMKTIPASDVKTYAGGSSSSAADDITAGDAAVTITTSSGNITIDAAANNTDIIFKGTDATSDITMLTLDGSEAGAATFNSAITGGGLLTTGGNIVIPDAGHIGSASDTNAITISSGGVVAVTATTASSSATTGALTVGGGAGVAADLSVGDDLRLISDAAVLSFGADSDVTLTHVADTGILLNSTMAIQFNDASQYINAPSNAILDINATDEIELNATLVDVNANLDVSGTLNVAGATTTAALTASGILKTDDTTEATSTTDGSLQTDGGLSVAKDVVAGDDVKLLSDAAVLSFGADSDVTLTHVADTGILLNSTMAIQFNDASQSINAPSNAILDINATDEIELNATLVDVNANLDVSGTYTGGGTMTTGGNIVIPNAGNIGSASDTDAIAIASNGVVTFSQVPVLPDDTVATADIQDDAVTIAKLAGAAKNLTEDTFDGDGSDTTFTLSVAPPTKQSILVTLDGVVQPIANYSLSTTTLTMSTAPPNGVKLRVLHLGVGTANVPVDDSVTTAKIAADAVTGAKIADDAINSEHYTDGSIDTAHIADLNVTTAKIAADAITEAKIADDAVEHEHLNNNVISGQTEITSGLADADELLYSDGGTLKKVGLDTLTTHVAGAVSKPASYNAIINGDFVVWQRGTSFTATGSANNDDSYTADRWIVLSDGNDIVDVTRAAGLLGSGVTGGAPVYSLAMDVETADKKFGIVQIVEYKNISSLGGVGTATVSLSFVAKVSNASKLDNVKAAVIGWAGTGDSVTSDVVSAWNAEGTDPTLATNWTYENTPANLNVTTSDVRYTIENISVDTATTNNLAVFIWSDVTDTTTGHVLYVADVQLEPGATANDFTRELVATTMTNCQRYYHEGLYAFVSVSATQLVFNINFPVQMRTSPTTSHEYPQDGTANDIYNLGTAATPTFVPNGSFADINGYRFAYDFDAGLTADDGYQSYFYFDAEL